MGSLLSDATIVNTLKVLSNLSSDTESEIKVGFLNLPSTRQPVHVLYGGAHLFKAEAVKKLGGLAINSLEQFAPDATTLAKALGFSEGTIDSSLTTTLYSRIKAKLETEPIEDYRIDFEDGYGFRSDSEEDKDAINSAREVAKALNQEILPPNIGIRIKPLSNQLAKRSITTLDLFFDSLLSNSKGVFPPGFIVTLPKIYSPKEVEILCNLLEAIEQKSSLPKHSIQIEVMIETPLAIINPEGKIGILDIVKAAKGRCIAAHLGAYDFLSLLDISSNAQSLNHQSCDLIRNLMLISLSPSRIRLSDGATNLMPVPVHKADRTKQLGSKQIEENRKAVHSAWRLHFNNILSALHNGFYQGWDLHPAQLVPRYAANYFFFLSEAEKVIQRLSNFVTRSAQASLIGNDFDDAATAQGLLNFIARAFDCKAIGEAEIKQTGLALEQIKARSFHPLSKVTK